MKKRELTALDQFTEWAYTSGAVKWLYVGLAVWLAIMGSQNDSEPMLKAVLGVVLGLTFAWGICWSWWVLCITIFAVLGLTTLEWHSDRPPGGHAPDMEGRP